jgi:hypothetical protein
MSTYHRSGVVRRWQNADSFGTRCVGAQTDRDFSAPTQTHARGLSYAKVTPVHEQGAKNEVGYFLIGSMNSIGVSSYPTPGVPCTPKNPVCSPWLCVNDLVKSATHFAMPCQPGKTSRLPKYAATG